VSQFVHRAAKLESLDTVTGKYSARKVRKWRYNRQDLMNYLEDLDDDITGALRALEGEAC
jgi:hypothetical protein